MSAGDQDYRIYKENTYDATFDYHQKKILALEARLCELEDAHNNLCHVADSVGHNADASTLSNPTVLSNEEYVKCTTCEHVLGEINSNSGILSTRFKFCNKCREVIGVGTPSPSQDKTEIKPLSMSTDYAHGWWDAMSKCGASGDYIIISRKVASYWVEEMDLSKTNCRWTKEFELLNELRRALTNNSKS